MNDVEQSTWTWQLIEIKSVARILNTTPEKIKSGILNGTLPIGTVMNSGGRDETRIPLRRFEKWMSGEL